VLGERLLADAVLDPAVRAAVRHHHERYDGLGYPDRLAGKNIPLLARLLSVADGFDALTSPRPYRRAMPLEHALEVLRGDMGTRLDPYAVVAFHRVPVLLRQVTGLRRSWAVHRGCAGGSAPRPRAHRDAVRGHR
jgi:HD-GYP domain-containing protein (c-di-GMP phosphodiesterase class II)